MRRAGATVLVSGYPSILYDDELYADWWRTERVVLRRTSNGRGGRNFHAVEAIWCNRPLDSRLFNPAALTDQHSV